MSEYLHVEKPFLAELAFLDWSVIDQGCRMLPIDPAARLRALDNVLTSEKAARMQSSGSFLTAPSLP